MVFTQIQFDQNPYGTFFAGQIVTGKVTIQADKPKNVKGVLLKIYGYAETLWTESQSVSTTDNRGNTHQTTQSVTYSGREDYLSSLTYLMGSPNSDTFSIAPGIHTFNFACQLPITCPSSFEGNKGKVRYVVRVSFIRPWKFDQNTTLGFTVLKLADLNYDSPVLRIPAQAEIVKTFCCGPCKSKPLILTAKVPKSGYVSGENIVVTVDIYNPTKTAVKEVKISLNLFATYFSQYPRIHTCVEKFPLVKVKTTSLGSDSHSKITETIQTKTGGIHGAPSIAIPITIGNVPLMQIQNTVEQPIMQSLPVPTNLGDHDDGKNTLPRMDPYVNPTAPYSPDALAPPSYEESLFLETRANVNEDDKNTNDKCDFAPRYPVYTIAQHEATAPEPTEAITPSGTAPKKTTWL